MRSSGFSSSSSELAAKIGRLTPPTDDNARFFVAWWLRMHQRRNPLVDVALKFVEWAKEGAATQRYVWEVCRWPQARSFHWMFVCWMVDDYGLWMKQFPSKRAAMAYFRQVPAAVMTRSARPSGDDVREGGPA